MGWVIGGAWIGAAVVALLVLGFCAYEIHAKISRLRREMQRLDALTRRLETLQTGLAVTQQRAAELRV